MIKKMFNLLVSEIKLLHRQCLLLLFISSLILSVSLGVLCFSTNLKSNYADALDKNSPNGFGFSVDVDSVNQFLLAKDEVNTMSVTANSLTNFVKLKSNGLHFETEQNENTANGIISNNYHGKAYYFNDKLPKEFDVDCVAGEFFNSYIFNNKIDGYYSIFTSDFIALKLNLEIGDYIEIESNDSNVATLRVAGVYAYPSTSKRLPYFVLPLELCREKENTISNIQFAMYINKSSDIFSVYNSLVTKNIAPKLLGNFFEEIKLINTNEILLIALSVVISIVAFFILNNMLTLIISLRQEFIAKLKLLGLSSNFIAAMYFSLFVFVFLLSFALSIVLNYIMKGYYENIAQGLFQYNFTINIQWYSIVAIFLGHLVLITIKHVLFKRKISKISPLEYMRDEK